MRPTVCQGFADSVLQIGSDRFGDRSGPGLGLGGQLCCSLTGRDGSLLCAASCTYDRIGRVKQR